MVLDLIEVKILCVVQLPELPIHLALVLNPGYASLGISNKLVDDNELSADHEFVLDQFKLTLAPALHLKEVRFV